MKDIDLLEELQNLNLSILIGYNDNYTFTFPNHKCYYTMNASELQNNTIKNYVLHYIKNFINYDNANLYVDFLGYQNLNRGTDELLTNFKKRDQNKLAEMIEFFNPLLPRYTFTPNEGNALLYYQTAIYQFFYNKKCVINFPLDISTDEAFNECYEFYNEFKHIVAKQNFIEILSK